MRCLRTGSIPLRLWICRHSPFKLHLKAQNVMDWTFVCTSNAYWSPGKSWKLFQWIYQSNPPLQKNPRERDAVGTNTCSSCPLCRQDRILVDIPHTFPASLIRGNLVQPECLQSSSMCNWTDLGAYFEWPFRLHTVLSKNHFAVESLQNAQGKDCGGLVDIPACHTHMYRPSFLGSSNFLLRIGA